MPTIWPLFAALPALCLVVGGAALLLDRWLARRARNANR